MDHISSSASTDDIREGDWVTVKAKEGNSLQGWWTPCMPYKVMVYDGKLVVPDNNWHPMNPRDCDCWSVGCDDWSFEFTKVQAPEIAASLYGHLTTPPEVDSTSSSPTELKLTNPKDIVGSDKIGLHLWPETATAVGSLGFLDGALKYGRSNFRAVGVRASIYVDAAKRHLNYWFEGEEVDPDSGVPHLGHALACIAILVDAQAAGKLNDDRMYPGGYREFMTEMTAHVARLKALHANREPPKHYTIADADADNES